MEIIPNFISIKYFDGKVKIKWGDDAPLVRNLQQNKKVRIACLI